MNFSKIRMMFFDFDDTLLIHYREQKLDATADAHRARLLRYEAENRGGYRVFDEIGEANTLVQHFLESCDGIPKYCITRVQDSMTLPYKKQWLEMHYPGQFLDVIGTATPRTEDLRHETSDPSCRSECCTGSVCRRLLRSPQ